MDGNDSGEELTTTKEQVLRFVKEHPGTHLREIKRALNLAMGVTQYHISSLEKNGKIFSKRRGIKKRFYPTYTFGESQAEVLHVLSQENERDLLLFLLDNPNSTQKELAQYINVAPATVNWHMKRLIDGGLVSANREGQFVKYNVKGNPKEILELLKNYHPSIWARWADRLYDVLNEVEARGNYDDIRRKGKDKESEFEW